MQGEPSEETTSEEGVSTDAANQLNTETDTSNPTINEELQHYVQINETNTTSILPCWYPIRERRRPKIIPSLAAAVYDFADVVEPETLREAMDLPQSEMWRRAVNEEFSSLLENKTREITDLPAGRKAIKCKWIFKVKQGHADVPTIRFKARLMARGFTQRGVDFHETYAPVLKHTSLRVVLAIAAAENLEMVQLDIQTAFLYGELEEELFMEQPGT